MSGGNVAILMGRVGSDAEVKTFDSGQCIITFSIATSEKWLKDGQQQQKTVWHRCKKWAKSPGLAQYIKRGDMLFVRGSIDLEEWEQNGEQKSRTVIKVQEVEFTGKSDRQESGGGQPPPLKGGFGDDDIKW